MNNPPECRHCGACCFSNATEFVRVTGADWKRLGADADRFAHFIGNRAFMRMCEGHCAALEVRRATGEFFCTIYGHRPQVCRDLGRGSPQCDAERETKAATAAGAMDMVARTAGNREALVHGRISHGVEN